MAKDYHTINENSYYYDSRYTDARDVADKLIRAFENHPKFQELLAKDKLLKSWVASLNKKKVAIAEARAKAAQEQKKKDEVLAKLSEEEKLVFGFSSNKKKNGKVHK